jgi:hypothetical protein
VPQGDEAAETRIARFHVLREIGPGCGKAIAHAAELTQPPPGSRQRNLDMPASPFGMLSQQRRFDAEGEQKARGMSRICIGSGLGSAAPAVAASASLGPVAACTSELNPRRSAQGPRRP